MYPKKLFTIVLVAALIPFAAHADDIPLDIKTDLKGKFYLVEKAGSTDNPTLVIKSVVGDYNDYSKREFDCTAHTVRYLSTGKNLQQMVLIQPESEMSAITPDSINDQLLRLACSEQ
jgi:hypothetical protein